MRRPLPPPQCHGLGAHAARVVAGAHRAARLAALAGLAGLAALQALVLVLVLVPARAAEPAPAAAPPAAATAAATAVPVPLADFFRLDQMAQPRLSPSGRHLAVQVASPQGRQRLAVVRVEPPRSVRLVAGFDDADIGRVQWAGDDRLVFELDDRSAAWFNRVPPGLFAVDADGGNFRVLVRRDWGDFEKPGSGIVSRELPWHHRLLRVLDDGSADVMVQQLEPDPAQLGAWRGAAPLRLDARSGRGTPLGIDGPRGAQWWWLDGVGQPRMALVPDGAHTEFHWRPAAAAPWQLVRRQRRFSAGRGDFLDVITGADGGLYVVSSRSDADTTALYRFDPATARLADQPLVSIDGFDFDGEPLFDRRTRRLIGVRYLSDASGTAWLDDRMKAVQARIDQHLPGLVNLVDPATCGCSRWMVVTSHADRQPQLYWLYDSEADKLDLVGQAQPQIDPRRMARRDFVRFKARDGLEIPLHVTRPAGKGPWPAVVLVHGGPHVRGGAWGWEAESQFLASRGYLVLEPEFRGSTGYGARLFRAGWKQWGLAAQDDMADAARWAVARGEAEPARICIAGASYGGYATLMGLIRDPDLYRCGVAWAAVTDIKLMHDIPWSDLSDVWRRHGMPALIGDPVADAAQLAATSPLRQVARLKQPLLLAIGGQDRRVPPEHGLRLRDALRAQGTPPEWVQYADEGHGFYKPQNLVDFWQRVERFLDRHIGPASVAAAPVAPPPVAAASAPR